MVAVQTHFDCAMAFNKQTGQRLVSFALSYLRRLESFSAVYSARHGFGKITAFPPLAAVAAKTAAHMPDSLRPFSTYCNLAQDS